MEESGVVRRPLLQIYEDIERRTRATIEEHTWWPCRRGCDSCCHRLVDIPQLVRAEWELLREGIEALPSGVRVAVDQRIATLAALEVAGELPRHITCPLLDEQEGACLVYAQRPSACRTYGFYVERGIGLHCDQITLAIDGHEDVVWGNQEGVDGALARLARAAPRPLTAWVASSSSSTADDVEAPPPPSRPSSAM